MTGARRKIPPATEAALWTLSNGRCYAPGCPFPVVFEVRPGVYRKNAWIAHIYGVRPGTPRHRPGLPDDERDGFKNLLLLCLAHHEEVDDAKTGEERYPEELLHEWKSQHEGFNAPALAALGPVSDQQLTELLLGVFAPPVERLEELARQLEETGTLTAASLGELRQIVNVLTDTTPGFDSGAARALAYAAEVFNGVHFSNSARQIAQAAEAFENMELPTAARRLADAAQRMRF